jgi:hypothetical protein
MLWFALINNISLMSNINHWSSYNKAKRTGNQLRGLVMMYVSVSICKFIARVVSQCRLELFDS